MSPAPCADCTLEKCIAKPFRDVRGVHTHTGWRCLRCGSRWMVPHRRPSRLARLRAWLMAPIQH